MSIHLLTASAVALAALALLSSTAYAYDEVPVSGGGTIRGKVSFGGTVPTKKIIPTKDRAVCGGPRDEPQIRVGADQGVQDAVVYLWDVAKGKAWGAREQRPVLDNKVCRFEPPIQVMRAGEIDIHNSDPVLHNTHGFYGPRAAGSENGLSGLQQSVRQSTATPQGQAAQVQAEQSQQRA